MQDKKDRNAERAEIEQLVGQVSQIDKTVQLIDQGCPLTIFSAGIGLDGTRINPQLISPKAILHLQNVKRELADYVKAELQDLRLQKLSEIAAACVNAGGQGA